MKTHFKIIILIFILSVLSCDSDDWTENFKLDKGVITEVNKRHWGKGYYIETMTFQYNINGKNFTNQYESPDKEQAYTSSYSVNDTLFFMYRPNNPNKFRVYKSSKYKSNKK